MTITQEHLDTMRQKALVAIGMTRPGPIITAHDPARTEALRLAEIVLWYAPGMTVLACDEEKVRELVEETT